MTMQKYDYVHCYFFVKGRLYGMRHYAVPPCIGDEIALGPDDKRKYYKVIRRVFGNEGPDSYCQRINIELKAVK